MVTSPKKRSKSEMRGVKKYFFLPAKDNSPAKFPYDIVSDYAKEIMNKR